MLSLKNKIEILEKEEIVKALQECSWVKTRAAKKLGITERMIGYKIKKYEILRIYYISSSKGQRLVGEEVRGDNNDEINRVAQDELKKIKT